MSGIQVFSGTKSDFSDTSRVSGSDMARLDSPEACRIFGPQGDDHPFSRREKCAQSVIVATLFA
jgi:hypothetical protein